MVGASEPGRARPPAFGISWVVEDIARYGDLVRRCEDAGFSLLGVPDTQAGVYREMVAAMTIAAQATENLAIASMVTNPLSRTVAVAAAAFATLAELAPGRIAMGIGVGDSGVLKQGLRPARQDDLLRFMTEFRQWLNDATDVDLSTAAVAGGARYVGGLPWARGSVPILVAAEGPRRMAFAGRYGDGALLAGDNDPAGIGRVNAALAQARAERPDPAGEFSVWRLMRVCIADSREEALRTTAPAIAAAAHHAYRYGTQWQQIPDRLVPALDELKRSYVVGVHNLFGQHNPNGALLTSLGLTEELAPRFSIAGTAPECAEQLRTLAENGADRIVVRPITRDPWHFLKQWDDVRELL